MTGMPRYAFSSEEMWAGYDELKAEHCTGEGWSSSSRLQAICSAGCASCPPNPKLLESASLAQPAPSTVTDPPPLTRRACLDRARQGRRGLHGTCNSDGSQDRHLRPGLGRDYQGAHSSSHMLTIPATPDGYSNGCELLPGCLCCKPRASCLEVHVLSRWRPDRQRRQHFREAYAARHSSLRLAWEQSRLRVPLAQAALRDASFRPPPTPQSMSLACEKPKIVTEKTSATYAGKAISPFQYQSKVTRLSPSFLPLKGFVNQNLSLRS